MIRGDLFRGLAFKRKTWYLIELDLFLAAVERIISRWRLRLKRTRYRDKSYPFQRIRCFNGQW